jgi:hypothetical protein
MAEQPPRLYFYPDENLKERIQTAAKKSTLSVSAWLRLAALEKLQHERRALDEYRERKEGK